METIGESVRKRNNIFTASPLRCRHLQNSRVDRRIRIRTDTWIQMREAQKETETLIQYVHFHT
jgi:hypothetical protein